VNAAVEGARGRKQMVTNFCKVFEYNIQLATFMKKAFMACFGNDDPTTEVPCLSLVSVVVSEDCSNR